MPLIVRDPQTHAPGPDEGPGVVSTMPAGGTPDGDRRFLAWIDRMAVELNARSLDRLHRYGVEPRADPVRSFQLMNHLYKHLAGLTFPDMVGPTYSHKIRFLAIQHQYRMPELSAELAAYVDRITEVLLPR